MEVIRCLEERRGLLSRIIIKRGGFGNFICGHWSAANYVVNILGDQFWSDLIRVDVDFVFDFVKELLFLPCFKPMLPQAGIFG